MRPELLTSEEYRLLRTLVSVGPQNSNNYSDISVMRLFSEDLAILNKQTNKMEATDKGRSVGRMFRPG